MSNTINPAAEAPASYLPQPAPCQDVTCPKCGNVEQVPVSCGEYASPGVRPIACERCRSAYRIKTHVILEVLR